MSLWTGTFGDQYTARNRVATIDAREAVWSMLLPEDCESVLEIGANTGQNIEALATLIPGNLYACEPNDMAREDLTQTFHDINQPQAHITADFADKLSFPDNVADLAFTCGVLIHVPTDKLLPSMKEIHRCAKRWIVCAEYFSPSEEMIPYRGQNDALWRRDYGSLWLDNFSDLNCIASFFAWKRMTGLDNLTFWVFEKGPRAN